MNTNSELFEEEISLNNSSIDSDSESNDEKIEEKSECFYEQADNFLNFAMKHKKIKILSEITPFSEHISLLDIALHKKGPLEDKLYARYPIFYRNIRRGNSILQIYDGKNEIPKRIICKRGLRKFYDITTELMEYTKALNNNTPKLPFLTSLQKKIRNIIFEKIEYLAKQPTMNWQKMTISKIYKENGEHCQIGYTKEIDAWVIASKNVTILIRTKEDLALYNKERHYWPKIIAETWFEYLENLSENKISDLKNELKNYTLLGEHCGHPKHTHIIKYFQIEIKFYAIVPLMDMEVPCLEPVKAIDFFKKFGLKNSKIEIFKDFKNFNDFLKTMENLLMEIELGTCEKEGEGSVIYITYENQVVSMSKMKTYEYLILRELRENLKKQVNKAHSKRFLKYKEVVNSIFQYKKLEKSKEYYFELGKIAFQYVFEKKTAFSEVYYNFVDLVQIFTKELQNFKENEHKEEKTKDLTLLIIAPPFFLGPKTNEILKESLKTEEILLAWNEKMPQKEGLCLYTLYNIPRITAQNLENIFFVIVEFNENLMKNSVDLLETCPLPLFNKQSRENKFLMISNLAKKIPAFEENLKQFKYPYIFVEEESIKKEKFLNKIDEFLGKYIMKKQIVKEFNESNKQISIFLPFGLPGMGKSYLAECLKSIFQNQKEIKFYCISSDHIRLELQTKNLKADTNEFYEKTRKKATKLFYDKLKEVLNEISNNENKSFLFIDKIHGDTILETTLSFIYENLKNYEGKINIFGVIPTNKVGKNFKINEYTYPFSEEFIMKCLFRCMNRENHETLDLDVVERVKIFLKFLQIFRNFKYKNVCDLNGFIEIPFIKEENLNLEKFYKLFDLIKQALNKIKPKTHPKDSPIFYEIAEEFYRVFTAPPEEMSKEEFIFILKDKFQTL